MIGFFTRRQVQRTIGAVYFLAVILSAFGIFHDHGLALPEVPPAPELHDRSCTEHIHAVLQLSEHCARCQFLLAADFTDLKQVIDNLEGVSLLVPNYRTEAPSVLLHADLRGPPRFL